MIHELKIFPEYYNAVVSGLKTFEVRYNDRDFKVGDSLILKEYSGVSYTGRQTNVVVTYIVDDPSYCKEGYVIMSIVLENIGVNC